MGKRGGELLLRGELSKSLFMPWFFYREMYLFRAISSQIKLFELELVIVPICVYGSEVLGYENLNLVEQIIKYKLICKRKHES